MRIPCLISFSLLEPSLILPRSVSNIMFFKLLYGSLIIFYLMWDLWYGSFYVIIFCSSNKGEIKPCQMKRLFLNSVVQSHLSLQSTWWYYIVLQNLFNKHNICFHVSLFQFVFLNFFSTWHCRFMIPCVPSNDKHWCILYSSNNIKQVL